MTEREIARKKAAARKARMERERKARNRRVVLTIALMLVVCVASIGGTIAWLQDKTETVVNTFSPSTIGIELTETQPGSSNDSRTAKMVPGLEIAKNPAVKVAEGSEPCWVFVKVVKTNNPDTFLDYSINSQWTALTGVDGVYYIKQDAASAADTVGAGVEYAILTGDKVTVKDSITKEQMNALNANTHPTLSFTAYAIQQYKFDNAAAAWAELNPTNPEQP